MNTTVSLKLLTIITEGLLKEEMITLIRRHGATGYTISRSEGEGSRGVRAHDWEGPNLRLECITSEQTANLVLEELGRVYFEDYAVIAWISDVTVLRGDKFSPQE